MPTNAMVSVLGSLAMLPAVAFSATLVSEPFEDTSYSSRGWYDTTGGALSSTEYITGSTKSFQCRFPAGGKICSGGTPGRILFPETDAVYISYWIKHSTNWTGSNKSYHPHEFYLLTNQDGPWTGLAWTHLTGYIEDNEGTPILSIQDGQNIDKTKIGQNLVKLTESRAVAGCNGDSDGYGNGACYPFGTEYRNGKQWKAGKVYFSDTAGLYYKGDWHHVEAFFKVNGIVNGKGIADGVLKYWYDGQLIIDRNNVMIRTGQYPSMKFNQFIIAPYIGDGSPVDQTFWIDNLVIGTAPPATALAPPRNLREL